MGPRHRMKRCTYCGREQDDSAVACLECGSEVRTATPTPPPESRPPRPARTPRTRDENVYVGLCVSAQLSLTLVRYIIPQNLLVAVICAGIGMALSVIVLGWTLWNLSHRRRYRILGLATLMVCCIQFALVSDYFASHRARERQRLRGTNGTEAVFTPAANGPGMNK